MDNEYIIDDKKVRKLYDKYIEDLSQSEACINLKSFQLRDKYGDLIDPTLFIQLIIGLSEESIKDEYRI